MDEKRAWDEIKRANKTAEMMKKLAELSGFTVAGMITLTSKNYGIKTKVHYQEAEQ